MGIPRRRGARRGGRPEACAERGLWRGGEDAPPDRRATEDNDEAEQRKGWRAPPARHASYPRWHRIELREAELREAEWLVIRQLHEPRQYSYTLLNAPADTPVERIAEWSTRRYFVERTFEDAKSKLGWAEFAARKYRAWGHHLALTAAALCFAAQTKLEWEGECSERPWAPARIATKAS